MAKSNNYLLKLALMLLRLALKNPSSALLIAVLGGGVYAYEYYVARPQMLYQGEPHALKPHINTFFRVLRNHGFIVGYSDWRGNPLWVEYALTQPEANAPDLKRPSRFELDWRSLNRLDHESYSRSGYDRGHMAPNYAISHLYGRQGQEDSFLMTNITPQKPNLNQKWWQRLEALEIDEFTKHYGKVWVITGPIFKGSVERLSSDWRVEVPDAFYKVYLTESNSGRHHALAFIAPQTVSGKEPLSQFVTTIDDVEAQTGLDFFAELPDSQEKALESSHDQAAWHLPNR
ncbi:DNA/RNA non-specific endonuclease [Methylocucumis oryzae]|nr:DNA/RNA non-specific endonuclease [Methylocucumis oryzae]